MDMHYLVVQKVQRRFYKETVMYTAAFTTLELTTLGPPLEVSEACYEFK